MPENEPTILIYIAGIILAEYESGLLAGPGWAVEFSRN